MLGQSIMGTIPHDTYQLIDPALNGAREWSPPMRVSLMENRNKQAGVVEWILIAAVAIGAFSGLMQAEKQQRVEAQYQQQQIDNIKAGGVNDGRVDW